MPKRVIILGGGVGGMSAAHELCERGFAVTVVELKNVPGGKARSIAVPNTGLVRNIGTVYPGRLAGARRRDLPGEHGFRFFPGFYRHLVDTMQRTPGGGGSCADNLVQATRTMLARFGGPSMELPTRAPRSFADVWALRAAISDVFDPDLGISDEEYDFFFARTWQIFTSCVERRDTDYEKISWWDYIGAQERSEQYQKLFGRGGTQSLLAARAGLASTKTIGNAWMEYYFTIVGTGADRVLNGPTSDVWIHPWLDYLRSRGVEYQLNSRVRSINCVEGCIVGATIERQGKLVDLVGDYYVAALPVDVMARFVSTEMIQADSSLASIIPLSKNVGAQNGIQLYLTEDVPVNPGHTIYLDSPWALTSVSQHQFWANVDLRQYGDGRVRGIISVDISDWNTPGLNGKRARECSREEIKNEVWRELKLSLNVGGATLLRDAMLDSWFLDPDIDPTTRTNSEPLLINVVDSWRLRPEAVTAIPNLFLASDYVRTFTDLACMEGANEAARRAVNGILVAEGMSANLCQIWNLPEPAWLQPWRAYDRARYQRGLPWNDQLAQLALFAFRVVQRNSDVVEQAVQDVLGRTASLDNLLPALQSAQSWPELVAQLPREIRDPIGALLRALAKLAQDPSQAASDALSNANLGDWARSLAALVAGGSNASARTGAIAWLNKVARAAAPLVAGAPLDGAPTDAGGHQRASATEPAAATTSRVRFVRR